VVDDVNRPILAELELLAGANGFGTNPVHDQEAERAGVDLQFHQSRTFSRVADRACAT
jgi:hypothetical protein